jgi:hypothetical protein
MTVRDKYCGLSLAALAAAKFTIGILFVQKPGSAVQFASHYFAAGEFARGVFAAGEFAAGLFAAGTFSIGVFSIGIFSIDEEPDAIDLTMRGRAMIQSMSQ